MLVARGAPPAEVFAVQALGGALTVHSPAGAGTRLLVDLPVEVDGD